MVLLDHSANTFKRYYYAIRTLINIFEKITFQNRTMAISFIFHTLFSIRENHRLRDLKIPKLERSKLSKWNRRRV